MLGEDVCNDIGMDVGNLDLRMLYIVACFSSIYISAWRQNSQGVRGLRILWESILKA